MKIAFITYEYPPDTSYGGIATYVHQAAQMLVRRGHQVEVFAGSPLRAGMELEDGVLVHRVLAAQQQSFAARIGECFATRHGLVNFDVLEGPDYAADAREAVRRVPDIPLVLKLHTPSILLLRLNYREHSFFRSVGLYWRGLRSHKRLAWGYNPDFSGEYEWAVRANEVEREHALQADEIASPSRSLGEMLIVEWGLARDLVAQVPYPYRPAAAFLGIPVETHTNVVTFVGRLEVRKGVIDMAKAIPQILRQHPGTRFRFVGASEPSPSLQVDMLDYLAEMVNPYREMVEFMGNLPYDRIPGVLAQTDVCVFPSHWENFPCVCLEAMAAARGIVASNAGGMHEMLAAGEVGLTVPPRKPGAIAAAVNRLLRDPSRRMHLGRAARERLLSVYCDKQVGILQESSYRRAIARRGRLGARPRIAV